MSSLSDFGCELYEVFVILPVVVCDPDVFTFVWVKKKLPALLEV